MNGKMSRRKIATYVSNSVKDGKIPSQIVTELAAYLIESGRLHELSLIVRTVEDILEQKGIVIATTTSAHELDDTFKTQLKNHIDANEIYLREVINPAVIGGVRLKTPSKTLDTTIAHKLSLLQGAKV